MVELVEETPRTKSISLELPYALGHRAGQHVDVRLTAEDGYQAQRSYSIGSAPEDPAVVLTVERLDDGEVSPYLTDELHPGDELELRGPIGGYFVWEEAYGGPVELIAGGSGIVPLHAILRHWAAGSRSASIRLLYSARSLADVIYRRELERLAADTSADIQLTLTRDWPNDWKGLRGRVDGELLTRAVAPPKEAPLVYICGPTPFVEAVAEALVDIGHDPGRVRTERFGPTGS
ncbi:MAG TPA: ferredoxin reductase [Solirubrobacteraceae bacterium]|nr:ferredoxin reductase [Solirubrobacteraceae bacterium]